MSGGHLHALHVHRHSPVHRMAPEAKVAALFVFVLGVVATPREAMWAFAIHAFLLLAVVTFAELPVGFVLRRMTIELPFIAFALFLPFLGGGPQTAILGVGLSVEGLWGAWNIFAKATLGVGASVTLIATTEIPQLLHGLDRLRVPRLFTAIAGFMVRYIEVIAGEVQRTRTAMTARGHDPRWLWQVGPDGSRGALRRTSGASGCTRRWWREATTVGCPHSTTGRQPQSSGCRPWRCR